MDSFFSQFDCPNLIFQTGRHLNLSDDYPLVCLSGSPVRPDVDSIASCCCNRSDSVRQANLSALKRSFINTPAKCVEHAAQMARLVLGLSGETVTDAAAHTGEKRTERIKSHSGRYDRAEALQRSLVFERKTCIET